MEVVGEADMAPTTSQHRTPKDITVILDITPARAIGTEDRSLVARTMAAMEVIEVVRLVDMVDTEGMEDMEVDEEAAVGVVPASIIKVRVAMAVMVADLNRIRLTIRGDEVMAAINPLLVLHA